jgi:hypothetical protein
MSFGLPVVNELAGKAAQIKITSGQESCNFEILERWQMFKVFLIIVLETLS